jgi:hypothetical protein
MGRSPNLLDRILGLYGADPNTHIPEGQRKEALGTGLRNAGIATAMAGGRGHDSLTPGQALGVFMGTMGQTGQMMGAQNEAALRKDRLQQMIASGQMSPEKLQAIMLELISQGDNEGARSISEVLKSMSSGANDPWKSLANPLYNTATGEMVVPPGGLAGAEIDRNLNNLAYPEGDPGGKGWPAGTNVNVPQLEDGTKLWEQAEKTAEPVGSARNRRNRNLMQLPEYYRKEIKAIEPSYRLTSAALSQVPLAKNEGGGQMGAQLAMLYGFIRALDPNSVVREGEVRLVQEGAPLRQKAIQWYNSIIRDQSPILTDDMIDQLATTMAELKRSNEQYMGAIRGHYTGVLGQRLLPGEDLEALFRDPTQVVDMGGADDMLAPGRAGTANFMYDPASYDALTGRDFGGSRPGSAALSLEDQGIVDEIRAIVEGN